MLNGITLIALVISIIVMLILAGVSINAVVGDNGILTKTQYASFLNEMAAVEEAVQLWKTGETIEANGENTKLIPANGLCRINELSETERLVGEVGYYRIWSMSETQPTTNILSDASTFNSAFESELIFYPAGVQDLYYLNNEALGIKEDKTYLIDAATGMIYSMTGIGLKGVRCYSSSMAKAVMNGESTAPLFAEAEVSGTATGDKLAGNVQDEFLEDGTPNPEYNPYGFKILASPSSNNIFKLYNNGDLYGKGIKGAQLNTSKAEMDNINQYVWNEFTIPENVGTVKKIVVGKGNSLFFIDSNDDLWAYGTNTSNKFGLSEEQLKEYTGREAIKVNLNGKKVKKIFPARNSTWLILDDNKLYVAGSNFYGELGLGNKEATIQFAIVPGFDNASDLSNVYPFYTNQYATILEFTDSSGNKTFYLSGNMRFGQIGSGTDNYEFLNFTRIWDGTLGPNIANDIKEVIPSGCCLNIIKKDGYVYHAGNAGYIATNNIESGSTNVFRKYTNMSNIVSCYSDGYSQIFLSSTGKVYIIPYGNNFGTDYYSKTYPIEITLPTVLLNEGIKEIYVVNGTFYYLSKSNKLYASGAYSKMGLNKTSGYSSNMEFINVDNLESLYNDNIQVSTYWDNAVLLYYKNGKYYMTGSQDLMYGEKILQKSWYLVAQNVKYFNARSAGYVDRNGDVWVAGDSRILGLGEQSKNYTNITNYTKIDNSNISGKAKEVYMADGTTYVLLNNKELWGTGMYSLNGTMYYPGWSEEENKATFVKILDNVEYFSAFDNTIRFAINSGGQCIVWGRGTSWGLGTSGSVTPKSYTLPSVIGGVSNISELYADASYHSHIITKTGELFRTGSNGNYAYYGAENNSRVGGSKSLTKWTSSAVNLNSDEKIIKFLDNQNTAVLLTSQGRVFGYGSGPMLGIDHSANDLMSTREITGIDNVEQLVMGAGWLVAVKNDGTVWGTGSNVYGILGRWIGIGRGESNSRYKTALNWVECPELEI